MRPLLEGERLRLELREPYTLAYDTVEAADVVLVRIRDESGTVGTGICAPEPAVTGEHLDDVMSGLACLQDVARDWDLWRPARCLTDVREAFGDRPSLRAGIDLALHDWHGRKLGVPVWRLLGGLRSSAPTSVTVGIRSVDDTVSRATAWARQGLRVIKLKGGHDAGDDIDRVRAVRRALGGDVGLILDANQGYGPADARRVLDAVAGELILLEQPTPADDLEALAEVTRHSPIPVIADESLLGPSDLALLAGAAHGVNVKLAKVGGLVDGANCLAGAGVLGLRGMVGCMDEPALGIAGALALALARPEVRWVDLDAHLFLVDDPTASAVSLVNGRLIPSERPGLGLP